MKNVPSIVPLCFEICVGNTIVAGETFGDELGFNLLHHTLPLHHSPL